MKLSFIYILTALLTFVGFSSSAIAFQVSVEDISNQTNCPPLDSTFFPGSCLVIPPDTLRFVIQLEENDDESLLENVHLVIHDTDGEDYQYYTKEGGLPWRKVSRGILENNLLLFTSMSRSPFDTENTITRSVGLDEFASHKGAKIFVGLRANDVAGFVEGSIKEVYEIQGTPLSSDNQ